jgi:pimeloyl-ACP methyl ester carboxylesterase
MSRTSEHTSRAAQVEVELPGFTLAALRTGGETNPPVLLVPGWTGSKEDFGPILEPLGEAGYLVTAVDQRGQFRSPFRPDGDYSPIALGNDLRLAAAALGGGVHLLGHSFGGLVARAAVLAAPDQFRSLVLLDSGPAGVDDGRRERLDLMRPVLAQHGLAAVYQALVQLDASEPGYKPPSDEEARFMRERFLASDPQALIGMAEALIDEPDLIADLAAADLPILVACGADGDVWSPQIQAGMARRLGAPYTAIAGAAHSPAVENPTATVATLVEFWRSAENHG